MPLPRADRDALWAEGGGCSWSWSSHADMGLDMGSSGGGAVPAAG